MIKFLLLFLFISVSSGQAQKNLKVDVNGDEVELNWGKSSKNILYFELERKSAQADTWKEIARVDALTRNTFFYKDSDLPAERFFYRIKAVDNQGNETLSKTREADLNKPFRFTLTQNYPNPFNPKTMIKYSIPDAAFVDLRIFNLLGQEIQVLVSEYQEPGEFTINFNASELNSGLYIYKLIAGEQVLTRKMTLIK